MKRAGTAGKKAAAPPAAFRRLCVETLSKPKPSGKGSQPPSGGCVLKQLTQAAYNRLARQPPSGGCVLKPKSTAAIRGDVASRLQAAVC